MSSAAVDLQPAFTDHDHCANAKSGNSSQFRKVNDPQCTWDSKCQVNVALLNKPGLDLAELDSLHYTYCLGEVLILQLDGSLSGATEDFKNIGVHRCQIRMFHPLLLQYVVVVEGFHGCVFLLSDEEVFSARNDFFAPAGEELVG